MASRKDEELVAEAQDGDRGALEALLARHQDRVYRFGMKMCGDPHDAEDVLQETLLTVARRIGEFRGEASVSSWLYTIARSYCIKQRRRSKFAPAYEESLDDAAGSEAARLPDPARAPEDTVAVRQEEDALRRAIAELPERSREIVVLRDIEGLTAPEVAEVVGLSVEAVKSRLHRARLALREKILPLLDASLAAVTPASGCPDVLTLFSRKLEGEITAEVCAEMERHLEECEHCRGACDTLRRTMSLCRSSAEPQVPVALQEKIRKAVRQLHVDAG